MNPSSRSEVESFARALAALLAAWWLRRAATEAQSRPESATVPRGARHGG